MQKDVVGLKITMDDVLGMKITENKKSRNDKSKRNVTNVGSRNRETSQSNTIDQKDEFIIPGTSRECL